MRAALFVLAITVAWGADTTPLDRANALYLRTDYAGAINLLKQSQQDAKTLEMLGRAYFMNGEFHRATDVLEKAAGLNPNSSTIQMWLGRAYGRRAETAFPVAALGYASRTRQAFEKAVELDSTNNEAVNDLFEYYTEAPGIVGGGVDKARKLLPLIAKNDAAEGHFAAAKLAEANKEYHAAETLMKKAMDAAPREVGRILDLAKFLARRNRFDESEKYFQQAQKITPDAPKILYARAEAYVESKRNPEQARDLLKKYLASSLTTDDPPRSEAQKLLKRVEGS